MLHPGFIKMLKVIKEHKGAFREHGIPFPSISLLTNAITLNEGLSRELVEVGVVDLIRFSVDGGSEDKYEEIRRGAQWGTVYKNISDFVNVNKGKIGTGIICIVEHGRPCNTEWMSAGFRGLLELVDDVELRYPHDWIGDIEIDGQGEKRFSNRCYFLKHNLVVLPNGDVTVCCADLNGKGIVGNLYREDLRQICGSQKRMQMLRLLRNGMRSEIQLCRNCTGYWHW